MDLFSFNSQNDLKKPLAEQMRPRSWEDFLGRDSWTGGQKKLFQNIIDKAYLPNLILFGPPGSGKTTFAMLLEKILPNYSYIQVNAVDTGAKKLKEIGQMAKHKKVALGQNTILFIDEIHRLNKAQQDVLLPFSEQADFVLIGATTENPSYELNSALLSRCQVLTFAPLSDNEAIKILIKAANSFNRNLYEILSDEAVQRLIKNSQGDMRVLLNSFEQILESFKEESHPKPLDQEDLKDILIEKKMTYDRNGEEHYNCISAFIKSVRGSDPDAALYYLARMIKGGEDPVFIARRLVVLASEDVGNADPRALEIAIAGLQAVELVGLPEAGINLAQVATYLSSAPKSNRSYLAWKKALALVEDTGALPIPLALRSSQTSLSKSLGYGKGYKYSHDGAKSYIKQNFLPKEIQDTSLYEPIERGFEKKIIEYLKWIKE
ncbi:MAG: replication-associated recombination protein A [Bdellovibrionaceae bacterium]|nr:replication-associated recombination protein A [Pseudobdellovibrionaceae bacterium]